MPDAETENKQQPLFLIAVPQLGDPNFARSVVLLLHQGSDGALGLVVNNPLDLTLGSFAREHRLPCHSRTSDIHIFRGGPVEPARGWILHGDPETKERQEILPGLSVSGSVETLANLMAGGTNPMKLLLGYAGWGPGQLESEIERGSWLMTEADPKHVLDTPASETWNAVLKDMGVDPARLALGTGIH